MPDSFEQRAEELFKNGYRFVRLLTPEGFYRTFHNKNFTKKEREDKRYWFIESPELYAQLENERQKAYEKKLVDLDTQDPCTSLLNLTKKINKEFKGKLEFKSKSGSVYTKVNKVKIRISDHYVPKVNPMDLSKNKQVDLDIVVSRDRTGCLRSSVIDQVKQQINEFLISKNLPLSKGKK